METMHMGTTWPETVPFWACLTAIWQVLLDDASNTSLLSLSVTTRSTHHHVGSQFTLAPHASAGGAFTSMHSDD